MASARQGKSVRSEVFGPGAPEGGGQSDPSTKNVPTCLQERQGGLLFPGNRKLNIDEWSNTFEVLGACCLRSLGRSSVLVFLSGEGFDQAHFLGAR